MRCWWLAGLLAVGLGAPVVADVVEFANGDRLTGQVVRLVDRKLTFRSAMAGEVAIPLERVAGLTTDQPVTVQRSDGGTVKTRVRLAAGQLALGDEAGLPLSLLLAINPPPPPRPGAARWSGSLVSNLGNQRGTTDVDNLDLAVRLARQGTKDKLTLTGAYRLDRQRDAAGGTPVTAEDSWAAGLRFDYQWTPRWFYFLNSQAKGDRARNLDHRLLNSAGIGYRLAPTPTFNFRADGGFTWLIEDYSDTRGRKEEATGQVTYRLEKRVLQRVQLIHGTEWYPTLDDFGDFLITSEGALRYYFTERLFVGLNATLDYQSEPAANTKPYTLKYGAGFGFAF